MTNPLINSRKSIVDILDFLRTRTQPAIAEVMVIAASEIKVIVTDEKTLEEYLILGLLHILAIFLNNCNQSLGNAIGLVMISSEALAELITTMKNGNIVTINMSVVTIVKLR